jgi:ABC-2 type transport system ATP-binding protein
MSELTRADSPIQGAPPIAISVRSLSKTFGATHAVEGVSFEVPSGSVFGLIGPNGAGKTTTFSMIAGYTRPSSGELFVLDYRPGTTARLKNRVGVLPQDALLPQAERVGDFLVFLARLQGIAASDARREAERVLVEVGGESWWKTRCGALSHGMAKRVGLAQALLGEPEVVLLDEPTAGLDPRVAHSVRDIIKARKGRSTLVVSSHNLHELEEICDAAAVLDRGRLVASGTMSALTSASNEIRVQLAPGPVPEASVRAAAGVTRVAFDASSRELAIRFDASAGDAEDLIARVLPMLFAEGARVSGVAKGHGLEQRVIELTK